MFVSACAMLSKPQHISISTGVNCAFVRDYFLVGMDANLVYHINNESHYCVEYHPIIPSQLDSAVQLCLQSVIVTGKKTRAQSRVNIGLTVIKWTETQL